MKKKLNQNLIRVLFLIRGLPGAGKSTVAKLLAVRGDSDVNHCPIFEADQYFMKNGQYEFKTKELGKAHRECYTNAERELQLGTERVFVSNTFTTEKELSLYLKLAKKYSYAVISMVIENRHNNSSLHNVPEVTLEKMKDRFSIKLI